MSPVTVHTVITDFFSSEQTVNVLFFFCLDVDSGVVLGSSKIHEGAAIALCLGWQLKTVLLQTV